MTSDREYFDSRITQCENRIFEQLGKMENQMGLYNDRYHVVNTDVQILKESRATWLKHVFAIWTALVGVVAGVVVTIFKKGGDS